MKNKGRDYSQLLIMAALAVTVTRYAGAFIASDVQKIPEWLSVILSALMGVSGVGMGVLDVVGLAYVFDGWRRAMPKVGQRWPFRFVILTVFVLLLALSGLMILTPFTVSRVKGEGMYTTLGDLALWGWSVAVNLAPLLLIGGIVTGQSGIVGVDITQDARTLRAGNEQGAEVSAHKCAGCGREFKSQQAKAAHSKHCLELPHKGKVKVVS